MFDKVERTELEKRARREISNAEASIDPSTKREHLTKAAEYIRDLKLNFVHEDIS